MLVKVRWMTSRTPRGELGNAYKILVGKHGGRLLGIRLDWMIVLKLVTVI